MLDLGTKAPNFNLIDVVSESQRQLNDVKGEKGTVIMFICNHCPYVIHIENEISALAKEYSQKGIGFVAISSNDIDSYPQDAPQFMVEQVRRTGFNFPYLFDEDQSVAKAYDAACTPDFYVFESNSNLIYRGRLDDSRPGNDIPVTGSDLRLALNTLLDAGEQAEKQYPSMGCNIKWKA